MLQQSVYNTRASTQETTASEDEGSGVLDAAALVPPHSKLKHLILYAAIGLVAGLVLGLGFVVIRAIISDRLYRRDDVARALGAPVKLSVGAVRAEPLAAGQARAGGGQERQRPADRRAPGPSGACPLPRRHRPRRRPRGRPAGRGPIPDITRHILRAARDAGRHGRPGQRRPRGKPAGEQGARGAPGERARRAPDRRDP